MGDESALSWKRTESLGSRKENGILEKHIEDPMSEESTENIMVENRSRSSLPHNPIAGLLIVSHAVLHP